HAEGGQVTREGAGMSHNPDAVTGWWRRISLRAKVTGVTVAVLALGLVVAGMGTVPILRNSLITNIDTQLPPLVSSDLAERWFDITLDEGALVFSPREGAPRASEYFFAVYGADGELLAEAGGAQGAPRPNFPETITLPEAKALEDKVPITLNGENGATFHAAVAVNDGPGAAVYVQYVAMPLDEADRIIGQYFGIYITVALVTILIAALLIRGLVTLTFRRLGQVEST